MKPKIKPMPIVIMAIVLAAFAFVLTFSYRALVSPNEYYKVYLGDKYIGLIESKDELEEYIDTEQEEIKEKYGVDKVYAPNGVEIVKTLTYRNNLLSTEEAYNIIKEEEPFTIKGYIISITVSEQEEITEDDYLGEILTTAEDNVIYVLNKEIFDESVQNIIDVFVGSEEYQLYLTSTQAEIEDYGSIIENVYLDETITIQAGNISVLEKIYTDSDELSRFLLYGTLEKQDTYTVKEGDSIESVAEKNSLSTDEFLMANPQLTSIDNLLYSGQEVNIGLIQPQISVVAEYHTVSLQTQKYQTVYEYDSSVIKGYGYEKRAGVNGLNDVTQKVQYINGKIASVVPIKTEVVKPTVDRIYVEGSKTVSYVGDPNNWGWPATCTTITSYYGWRWGRLHAGIDIAGCGYGSAIYSINNGTVTDIGYNSTMGYYVIVDHNNGWWSVYMHLYKIYAVEGMVVARGTKIGSMGNSGRSTGTHLHIGIYQECEWCFNDYSVDPLTILQ